MIQLPAPPDHGCFYGRIRGGVANPLFGPMSPVKARRIVAALSGKIPCRVLGTYSYRS